jgi:hypothetical protein
MPETKRRPLDIALILLGVMVVELALNRLAVPALRPATEAPGSWHRNLDQVALFIFHFASVLALAVAGKLLWDIVRDRGRVHVGFRGVLATSGFLFLGLAAWSVTRSPSIATQFFMQTAFAVTLILLLASQLRARGELFVKLGLVVLATPILLQYYAPFVLHLFENADLSMYPNIPNHNLPATMRIWGQHAVVIAALVSPYVFAPRPFRISVPRPAPLVIAMFVGLIAGIIVREYYEVGMELAMIGLGFDIGPQGAPTQLIALYLLALTSVTWSLVSCLTAESPARQRIGVGIGLVVVGGYAFEWPLQYLVALVGLLVIHDAGDTVAEEEAKADRPRPSFDSPPIPSESWQRYVAAVVEALRAGEPEDEPEPASAVSFDKELGVTETHIVANRGGIGCQIHIARADDSVQVIDVCCGVQPPEGVDPVWTAHARAERMLAIGAHPEPPPTSATAYKTNDPPFDRRFRVRDKGGRHTDLLMDDGLRARAAALVDGWMAYWPGASLYYRVFPGRGAPLDHPIPISELAFRGASVPSSTERLVNLVDLMADIAVRGGLEGVRDSAPPDEG